MFRFVHNFVCCSLLFFLHKKIIFTDFPQSKSSLFIALALLATYEKLSTILTCPIHITIQLKLSLFFKNDNKYSSWCEQIALSSSCLKKNHLTVSRFYLQMSLLPSLNNIFLIARFSLSWLSVLRYSTTAARPEMNKATHLQFRAAVNCTKHTLEKEKKPMEKV